MKPTVGVFGVPGGSETNGADRCFADSARSLAACWGVGGLYEVTKQRKLEKGESPPKKRPTMADQKASLRHGRCWRDKR